MVVAEELNNQSSQLWSVFVALLDVTNNLNVTGIKCSQSKQLVFHLFLQMPCPIFRIPVLHFFIDHFRAHMKRFRCIRWLPNLKALYCGQFKELETYVKRLGSSSGSHTSFHGGNRTR